MHFGFKELDVLLGDILTHLGVDSNNVKNVTESENIHEKEERHDQTNLVGKNDETTSTLMQIIRTGIFGRNKEIWSPIQALTHCNNLMPLFEHLKGTNRVSLAKEALENICSQKKSQESNRISEQEGIVNEKFYEPISINALIYLCSILSDSVNALTIEGN